MKSLILGASFACLAMASAHANDLAVVKDQSKVVKLATQASTIVVGNPAIADVSMQDGSTAFITGKGFGTTNVIAMDREGRQIASFRVTVTSETARSVTLMKGNSQITLSCAPRCQPALGSEDAAAAPPPSAPTD
jgi:Flp pilus assembly secretin CpaC